MHCREVWGILLCERKIKQRQKKNTAVFDQHLLRHHSKIACLITHLNGDGSTSSHCKCFSKSNPYVFLITLGQKLEESCSISNLCVSALCSWMRCIMYVLCTLPMYHLSTLNRNLYTFARSTQVFVHMQLFCHIWFFYTCACVRICQKTMKRDTYYQTDSMCVFLSMCECYDFITLFLQNERNKSKKSILECTVKYKGRMGSNYMHISQINSQPFDQPYSVYVHVIARTWIT